MSRANETLCGSPAVVREPSDFSYAIKNFLDRFKNHPDVRLLQDEPELLLPLLGDEGYADAFAASTVAYLCQVHDLPAPNWINQECRITAKPWFAAKSPNMRAILLQDFPAAFRVRNLFVSKNALYRA